MYTICRRSYGRVLFHQAISYAHNKGLPLLFDVSQTLQVIIFSRVLQKEDVVFVPASDQRSAAQQEPTMCALL